MNAVENFEVTLCPAGWGQCPDVETAGDGGADGRGMIMDFDTPAAAMRDPSGKALLKGQAAQGKPL